MVSAVGVVTSPPEGEVSVDVIVTVRSKLASEFAGGVAVIAASAASISVCVPVIVQV